MPASPPQIILASASPRRRHLLRLIVPEFSVEVSHVDEQWKDDAQLPEDIVEVLSRRKAREVAQRNPDAIVIGSDTIVVLAGEILEKPGSDEEAVAMLSRLSGQTHTVFTGLCVTHLASAREVLSYTSTRVTFAPMRPEEIAAYVKTGSPRDKAGAYGIQDDLGAAFIPHIEGDYYTVVGLPVHRLYTLLRDHFPELHLLS